MSDAEERKAEKQACIGDAQTKERATYIACRNEGHKTRFKMWTEVTSKILSVFAGEKCNCDVGGFDIFEHRFELSDKIKVKEYHCNFTYKGCYYGVRAFPNPLAPNNWTVVWAARIIE